MEEENKEKETEELGEAPETEVKVWGLGVLLKKMDKLIEKLDSVNKKLYFMEKRQQEWYEKEHPEAKRDY